MPHDTPDSPGRLIAEHERPVEYCAHHRACQEHRISSLVGVGWMDVVGMLLLQRLALSGDSNEKGHPYLD